MYAADKEKTIECIKKRDYKPKIYNAQMHPEGYRIEIL